METGSAAQRTANWSSDDTVRRQMGTCGGPKSQAATFSLGASLAAALDALRVADERGTTPNTDEGAGKAREMAMSAWRQIEASVFEAMWTAVNPVLPASLRGVALRHWCMSMDVEIDTLRGGREWDRKAMEGIVPGLAAAADVVLRKPQNLSSANPWAAKQKFGRVGGAAERQFRSFAYGGPARVVKMADFRESLGTSHRRGSSLLIGGILFRTIGWC